MKKLLYILPILCLFLGFFGVKIFIDKTKFDFVASSINGDVNMKSFDGQNKIFYFGYTFCPDVCPATLNILSSALNELKIKNTIILFITLDPKRDSLENLDEFVKFFYKNSYGLKAKNLDQMCKNFGVKYQIVKLENSAMEYSVAHSSSIYLFDKKGNFVEEVSNLTYENVLNSLKKLSLK